MICSMRNKKEGKTEKQRSRETEIKKNAQNGKHIIPPQKNLLCIYIYIDIHIFLHKTLCIYNYIIICTRSIVYIIHIYIYTLNIIL